MKIAVINEFSACDKNAQIIEALSGRGHEILNVGMKAPGDLPSLTYIHTGLLAGLVLNSGAADFVVGGCGTGIGFVMSSMMYPNVYCAFIGEPLDAYLFNRINAGNCISLALNKGWGWGSEVNLGLVFDQLFSCEPGSGYPEARRQVQEESRRRLAIISAASHRPMGEIVKSLDPDIVKTALDFPGVREILGDWETPKK